MAKKHPIYRLHKIKVHHNRWLIWAIAYCLIIAIGLLGYIKISQYKEPVVADNQFLPWHKYISKAGHYSVRYPFDWAVEADDATQTSFVPTNSSDAGVSIAVLDPTAEKSLRKTLKIASESRTNLDGDDSALINNSLGNGHLETIIMSLHNHRLYVIRGTDGLVKQLSMTFNFE